MAKEKINFDGTMLEVDEDHPLHSSNSPQDSQEVKDANEANFQRSKRQAELVESDWMACSDVTMSDAWKTYRQSLRDLPTHAKWPYLEDSDWPTKPT